MFLAINLISISIKIPLTSITNNHSKITGSLIPLELVEKQEICDFNLLYFNNKNLHNIIPIIETVCSIKQIDILKLYNIPAIILVEEHRKFESDLPIFSISRSDYVFLMNLIKSHIRTNLLKGDVSKLWSNGMLSRVIIGLQADMENMTILTSLIIQIPPIITILLIILLLRNFLENDDTRESLLHQDVKVDGYTMRRNNFCSVCSICYEEFNRNDSLRVLECDHCFHMNCIGRWLNRSNTCPMCRKDVYRGLIVAFEDIIYV